MLWAIVITVTILAFVVFFSPNGNKGGSVQAGNYGSIDGRRVTREEYGDAQREVYLRYFFSTGNWPTLDDENLMRDTYFRLFLIRKQEELGITTSTEAVAQLANQMLRSFNRGNPVPLDAFVNEVLRPQGLSAGDFANFVSHDLGIQELAAAAGLGGTLVTPQEARALYERENTEVSAQGVFFTASNYLAQIDVSPEAVAEFYTNRMAAYRLPERVQVAYVEFPASNFMADVMLDMDQGSNMTERIEATYTRLGGTNFFRDAKSPEEAKETIRTEFIKEGALTVARRKAYEFATALYAVEPASADNLGKLAEKEGLAAQLSAPFDRNFAPDELKVRSDFVKEAFALSSDEPFAGPILGENSAFVISFSKRLPSEIPALETILKQVTGDYRLFRAVSAARQAGASFAAMLAAGLPNGKSFSAVCAEAKVEPMLLPPFSLSTRTLPQVEEYASVNQLKQAAFSLEPGKAGEFVPTASGGFVLFLQSKLPLNETKMQTDLPEFVNRVRRTRENEAFNDWFRKEAERGLRDTPALRQAAPPAGMPAS